MKYQFPKLGAGTMLWLPKTEEEKQQYFRTFQYCLDNGLDFFDTAEVYGNGKVETLLGEFIRKDGRPVRISSKFAPPSKMNPAAPKRKQADRNSPEALSEALDDTLRRLGLEHLDLYLMHTPPKNGNIDAYMEVMSRELENGRIKAIGVCNHGKEQIEAAAKALEKRGHQLSAAMVGYNLLRRYPETNGVIDICNKYSVTLIPYAPLAEGTLTGKYRGERVPMKYFVTSYFGHLNLTQERDDAVPFIKRLFSKPLECDTKKIEPLMCTLEQIAKKYDKSIAQVSLNWLVTNPKVAIFTIPGIRSEKQAESNLGALGWSLSAEDREIIDEAAL
ncbi:MAG: aldo/keto reductase [Ruminococcus sp.]|nr:aldo/keto reductase [Ruminococcus sp.]